MAKYWFIRHGESMAQIGRWDSGNAECPLSPLGVRQAQAMAEDLAKLPVERVLVSPYLRARQTAENGSRLIELEHRVVPGLREREVGIDWKRWHYDPVLKPRLDEWDFRPPEGESIRDSALRAARTLAEHDVDAHTIVFAHGRILAGLLVALDGAATDGPIEALPNCVAMEREVAPGAWSELAQRLE
jgi:broad specificity phosphatase PhoE